MFILNAIQNPKNETLIQELQEKVISIQDHEISFLNDFIANIGWVFGIVLTVIGFFFAGVGWMINRSNQKAQEKMEKAEEIINRAKSSMDEFLVYKKELDEYRKGTEKEFNELIALVNSEEITRLKENVKVLSLINQVNKHLVKVEMTLESAKKHWERLQKEERIKVESLQLYMDMENCFNLIREYKRIAMNLTEPSKGDELLTDCEKLEIKSSDLANKISKLKVKSLFS